MRYKLENPEITADKKFISTHKSLINLLLQLGYTKITNGCCNGISLRWLEACLLDEEMTFDKRIKYIASNGNKLIHSIKAIKEKNKHLEKDEKASPFPEQLLDILAFCDGLKLYQYPDKHSSLFTRFLVQNDVDTISYFASSDKIASLGGLAEIYSEPGIYTKMEIKEYLDSLAMFIDNAISFSKETFGMRLTNHNHVLALIYKPGQGWKVMDINQYPASPFLVTETDLIAERIITSFEASKSPYHALNTSVFTLGNNPHLAALKNQLELFKKSHILTKEIADRAATNHDLAIIAAQNSHLQFIAQLAKYKVNLNVAMNDGATPAFIAAQNGHADVLAILAEHKVNLNAAMENGATPAFIAAQKGHILIIAALIKFGANFDLPFTASAESLQTFASTQGNEIIGRMNQFILSKHATSNKQNISMTPYDIAVVMGHKDVVQLLMKTSLVAKVNNEIARLKTSKSSRGLFLVDIDVIEDSNAKIKALKELRSILLHSVVVGKNMDELHEELCRSKEANWADITKQRNCIHRFFSPDHKSASTIVVEDILDIYTRHKGSYQVAFPR